MIDKSEIFRPKSGRLFARVYKSTLKGLQALIERETYIPYVVKHIKERREGMKKQRIISSSMVHIVFEVDGQKHEYAIDVNQALTPEVVHNIRDMIKEELNTSNITILNWQRYEMSC